MELNIILTPLVTLAGVWLGARYALRNEIIKKSIEIRASRIEQLAAECDDCLTGLINHAGMIASRVDSEFTVVSTLRRSLQGTVTVSELNRLFEPLDGSPWKLNADQLSKCRQKLSFHRPADLHLWTAAVGETLTHMYQFFMITMPGEEVRDMGGVERTEEDAMAFVRQLRLSLREITVLKKTLSENMALDFHRLTQPAEPATLSGCCRSAFARLRYFLT